MGIAFMVNWTPRVVDSLDWGQIFAVHGPYPSRPILRWAPQATRIATTALPSPTALQEASAQRYVATIQSSGLLAPSSKRRAQNTKLKPDTR